MSTTVHMGYTGECTIAGIKIPCTSMSTTLDQKLLFYDHVLGLKDKISGSTKTDGGSSNPQKVIYRYSPALAKASVSAPIIVGGFDALLQKAITGDELSAKLVSWKSGSAIEIKKARVSSLSLNVQAGDIAQFSAEIVGREYSATSSSSAGELDCKKLITWDQCEASGIGTDIASFSLTINNPIIPIYTASWAESGMMPKDLRIGIQEVSGTIGVYGFASVDTPTTGTFSFSIGDESSEDVKCNFFQPQDNLGSGFYIRTISFIGVSTKSETVW